MFYSQFILAKKGPLGTIWIAAHLERKLRKNQVADTDIGVSVDSILFPEAPIALRLSSHLLLGVVRIYSRKVNYLFHDCSEALLKIKQAFRSTAVDLPPEESTAPYHSITLPETFHLDDFELPESVFLHGNSVDHHVSTREQITLQDTRDGLDYSRSQFGLDERFGDGDASQIALDLDEDLFLDKVSSSQHIPVPFDAEDGMQHSIMLGNMDITEGQILYGNTNVTTPKDLSEFPSSDHDKHDHLDAASIKKNEDDSGQHGHNIQTPDQNEMNFSDDHIDGPSSTTDHISGVSAHSGVHSPELIECAQAPSTPSLIGEAIPANIQEIPPLSSQEKNLRTNYLDAETSGSPLHSEIDCPDGTDNNPCVNPTTVASESAEIVLGTSPSPFADLKSAPCEPQHSDGVVPDEVGVVGGNSYADEFQNEFVSGKADDGLPDHEQLHDNEDTILSETVTVKNPASAAASDVNATSREETNLSNQSLVQDANTVQHPQGTCNSTSNCLPGALAGEEVLLVVSSVDMQEPCAANVMETIREVPQTSEIVQSENTCVEKPQKLSSDANKKDNQLDHLNGTSSPEFPEPEKMPLAPPGDDNMSNDLGQLTSEKGVTGSEESVDRIKSLSRKKRHLTESISYPQNGSPAKLPGRPRGRRITVPEDDDLLASILVGRTANIKTQPTPHKVSSFKRPRLNPKAGVPKRKVLFDDTMVLHADAIRQQLINTEDIRRIRKKAPCTRVEIWMIQSCYEELEIFEESIFTGISAELHGLHNRTYMSNGKADSQYDRNQLVEPSKEPTLSRSSKIVEEICVEDIGEQIILSEKVDGETNGPSSLWVNTNSQDMVKSQADLSPPEPSNGSHPIELDDRCPCDALTCAPNFGNGSETSIDRRAEATEAHENRENREIHEKDESDVKSDDVHVHSEQQLADEAALSSIEIKDMNDDDMMVLDENLYTPDGANIIESKSEKIVDAVCHQYDLSDMGQIENNPTLLSMGSHEAEKCLHTDTSFIIGEGQLFSPDVTMGIVEPSSANMIEYQHTEKGKEGCLEISVDGEAFVQQLLHTEEDPFRPNAETENIPSTAGEGSGLQEFNPEAGMNGEDIPGDFTELPSSSDFWSAANGNDTDFLNVDDEEEYYEADDDQQNPREAQSQENSGWSSRTRGVARYLKTLFDDELGQGREMVTMDRLLVGKTRKEASRMFFETLVLKTKDYIHVEQEKPLACVSIKPRAKLLKSDF